MSLVVISIDRSKSPEHTDKRKLANIARKCSAIIAGGSKDTWEAGRLALAKGIEVILNAE